MDARAAEGVYEALADGGSVTPVPAQVNMAQANCYTLRRAAGAERSRAAYDPVLDFGFKRLKESWLFAFAGS